MEDICTGCLSSGRKLHFIGETGFYQLYSQILNEIPVQDVSQICIRVCWECCALLQKFQLFKAKVKQSYTELLWNIEPLSLPSRLTSRELHNLSYPDVNDADVKNEFMITNDIKTENNESEEHQEPEAFVNDLVVEWNAEKPSKKLKRKLKAKKLSKTRIRLKMRKEKKPEPIQSDVSDTDCLLEDSFQDDEIRTEESKKEDSDLKKLGVVVEIEKVEDLTKRPAKKLKRKLKEKKLAKTKIRVKIRKEKETIIPEPIQSDDSHTDCLLEDGFQDGEIRTEESKKKDSDLRKLDLVAEMEKVEDLPNRAVKNVRIPVVRVPKPPVELLPEKPQCVECGKMFSSRKTYRYHLNVLHKGNNRYPCPRCGKIYQWKSNLGRHMRTHKAVDAGELYCDTCDKSFASVATYRQHLRISRRHVTENEFSYTCNECGKKFVNKTRLRDHIDWEHLKKIKFRCQLCNKPFKCHTSLYVHLQNVHRNKEKKDNLCHVCGKSYQNAAKLKYHIIALHTGETPYQCSQCTAAFGWYSSLYRHIREVHYKVKTQPKKTKKSKKLDNEPPVYMNYHP